MVPEELRVAGPVRELGELTPIRSSGRTFFEHDLSEKGEVGQMFERIDWSDGQLVCTLARPLIDSTGKETAG
jgi:hypothetical protein